MWGKQSRMFALEIGWDEKLKIKYKQGEHKRKVKNKQRRERNRRASNAQQHLVILRRQLRLHAEEQEGQEEKPEGATAGRQAVRQPRQEHSHVG